MPIVPLHPRGEVPPQPLPGVAPNVPAAGDPALFGADRARDLQVAGQALGQAGASLAALYERKAQEANETRVQDLNNQFLDRRRGILQAYYGHTGADAIQGATTATREVTSLRDDIFGQAANPWQRQRLGRILDIHLGDAKDGIAHHVVAQQDVYGRDVAAGSIATARLQAIADPALLPNAVYRAGDAARVLHAGQPPEAIEAGVRAARGSVIAGVIDDCLWRNDPLGVSLFRQYGDRLDPADRRTLGASAEMLSTMLDAAAWLRERGGSLQTPTRDAGAPSAEPPPAVSSNDPLLDLDGGIVGTRERLAEIEARHRALTALNEQEFADNPARLRANRMAIDLDTARNRAAVKADTDALYADLRRHLTTGGPDRGPAVTMPSSLVMSRLTDAQRDAVKAQVIGNIKGLKPVTDLQTWYALHQGRTGVDAGERQRWAYTNLVPFMGRLSDEDYADLEKLQSAVRDDGAAAQSRLQIVNRMANHALRSLGIDPTPQPGAPPGSDAAQAAMFHRAVQDELSAFESRGRTPTTTETSAIVTGLKDTRIKSGWLKVSDPGAFPSVASVEQNNKTDESLTREHLDVEAQPEMDQPDVHTAQSVVPFLAKPPSYPVPPRPS